MFDYRLFFPQASIADQARTGRREATVTQRVYRLQADRRATRQVRGR